MIKMEKIYLSDYLPKDELIVKSHELLAPKYPVIDAHMHLGELALGEDYDSMYDVKLFVETLQEMGIKKVVNLDGLYGDKLDKMLDKIHPYEEFITVFGSVDFSKLDNKDFSDYVRKTIRDCAAKGVKGLKFLKDLSLRVKDSHNRYIRADDPRLKVIWETAAEFKLPVLIHIGDPTAFFKPIDSQNERFEELNNHPEWSFYGDEFFDFNSLMEMQQKLLEDNSKTTFIIPHVGSNSENLGFVSKCLDRYPNMYIDIADRIAELGRQPYTARDFLIRYKHRILFGTDSVPTMCLEKRYPIYYRFLETRDEYFDYSYLPIPPQGRWKIYGLGLDDETLKCIYYENAEKILNI